MRRATKKWSYEGQDYVIKKRGYGSYILNGYYCTLSLVWDYVDDEEHPANQEAAMKQAAAFVISKETSI